MQWQTHILIQRVFWKPKPGKLTSFFNIYSMAFINHQSIYHGLEYNHSSDPRDKAEMYKMSMIQKWLVLKIPNDASQWRVMLKISNCLHQKCAPRLYVVHNISLKGQWLTWSGNKGSKNETLSPRVATFHRQDSRVILSPKRCEVIIIRVQSSNVQCPSWRCHIMLEGKHLISKVQLVTLEGCHVIKMSNFHHQRCNAHHPSLGHPNKLSCHHKVQRPPKGM